jgi:hypothetical protein
MEVMEDLEVLAKEVLEVEVEIELEDQLVALLAVVVAAAAAVETLEILDLPAVQILEMQVIREHLIMEVPDLLQIQIQVHRLLLLHRHLIQLLLPLEDL